MGRHGAKEQRKLAKKKAKREVKHNRIAMLTSNDPTVRLANAAKWPIIDALVPTNLWEMGMGQLVFSRQSPDGKIAVAVFLVDVFCLGVKNALWRMMTQGEYAEMLDKIQVKQSADSRRVPPEYFSKLVHCAADYSQSLGFPPHSDFRHARLLLLGVDPSLCPDEMYFGKDGKPFYLRGPGESLEKARWIATRVQELGGHYMVGEDSFHEVGEGQLLMSGEEFNNEIDEEDDDEDRPRLEQDAEEPG